MGLEVENEEHLTKIRYIRNHMAMDCLCNITKVGRFIISYTGVITLSFYIVLTLRCSDFFGVFIHLSLSLSLSLSLYTCSNFHVYVGIAYFRKLNRAH